MFNLFPFAWGKIKHIYTLAKTLSDSINLLYRTKQKGSHTTQLDQDKAGAEVQLTKVPSSAAHEDTLIFLKCQRIGRKTISLFKLSWCLKKWGGGLLEISQLAAQWRKCFANSFKNLLLPSTWHSGKDKSMKTEISSCQGLERWRNRRSTENF